jgi:MFS family permease
MYIGLLSGLDQSLISGANLYMPDALNLNTDQVSWVNSLMPLGAVGGALLLGPSNENFGRKYSILIACILFTVGAALQSGAQNFGKSIFLDSTAHSPQLSISS